jgi:hypothetical protein
MLASATLLLALGVVGSFAPDAVLNALDAPDSAPLQLLVQVMGALYLGFAALNWMARENLIGGIYSRPLAVGNLLHFLSGGLAMLKLAFADPAPLPLLSLTLVYLGLAACFMGVLFRNPLPVTA